MKISIYCMITFSQFLETMMTSQGQQFFNHIFKNYKLIIKLTEELQKPQHSTVSTIQICQQLKNVAAELYNSSVNHPKDVDGVLDRWGRAGTTGVETIGQKLVNAYSAINQIAHEINQNQNQDLQQVVQELKQYAEKLYKEAGRWYNLSSVAGRYLDNYTNVKPDTSHI